MSRVRLHDRRQGETLRFKYEKAPHDFMSVALTYNEAADGRVGEAFLRFPKLKEGADICALVDHTCIILSIALQHGATMADIAHALGGDDLRRKPSSPIELVALLGADIDAANGFTGSRPTPPPTVPETKTEAKP